MKRFRFIAIMLPLALGACSSVAPLDQGGTIAQLRNRHIEIVDVPIEGGFEKAMGSYQRFLEESNDSKYAPEALRRLADLKIEREYGHLSNSDSSEESGSPDNLLSPPTSQKVEAPPERLSSPAQAADEVAENEVTFEERATTGKEITAGEAQKESLSAIDDLERAGSLEAIALYQKLLNEYPLYERNDQVLYQMTRAYEEIGRIEEAMKVMNRLASEYPDSRYLDEVQFRRAEYFFTRRKYLDAEDAYKSIVDIGAGSFYYQLALYKLGWTFYKQELYAESLDNFLALLDHKVSEGYDFVLTAEKTERQRIADTFRVISLGFSSIGGAGAVVDFFSAHGARSYEYLIYGNLAEYYYGKRRYSDATATYNAFVERNPFHEKAPNFHMRVIEINIAAGFPTLVIDSKKAFATNYGLKADYWQHFDPADRPDVLGFLKTNLNDLASHYHAMYQNEKLVEEKPVNFAEALHWYREYISSFPKDEDTPASNFQLASLFLENNSFAEAAVEFEKTAYDYPRHEKSSEAGYAAVYAYRQNLEEVPDDKKDEVKREAVRSSLKFADTYPEHEKAAIVLGTATNDLDEMEEYEQAVAAGRTLIEKFPNADKAIRRGAWLVVAHSSFELTIFNEAEEGYLKVLEMLPAKDKSRPVLVDNLAVSIYKQGENARADEDYRAAADHFLRVGRLAPTSKIRATAEYDGAAALIELKDWKMAATVLSGFRAQFSGHELQPEVTKKIAFVYKEDGRLADAAGEYERIERESQDDEIRRDALMVAADLYEQVEDDTKALEVCRRYVGYFPKPIELNLESRNKIAEILKTKGDQDSYLKELRQLVEVEAKAGDEQTPRTRYLASKAALVLTERSFDRFAEVKLVKPFEKNLKKKKELMKTATGQFNKLLEYQVGEVTAAATFYLAEMYANFSKSLMESERPEGLSPLEMEQYELAIEDQAYPFEEKAIAVHESNLELIALGVYNDWIAKSLQKLAKFMPARYDKPEERTAVITSLNLFMFAYGSPTSLPLPESETIGAEERTEGTEPVAEVAMAGESTQPEEVANGEETVAATSELVEDGEVADTGKPELNTKTIEESVIKKEAVPGEQPSLLKEPELIEDINKAEKPFLPENSQKRSEAAGVPESAQPLEFAKSEVAGDNGLEGAAQSKEEPTMPATNESNLNRETLEEDSPSPDNKESPGIQLATPVDKSVAVITTGAEDSPEDRTDE